MMLRFFTPLIVPIAAISQVQIKPANKITAAHSNTHNPVCNANCVVPVTQVPTGNVNAHQVNEKAFFYAVLVSLINPLISTRKSKAPDRNTINNSHIIYACRHGFIDNE